MIKLKKIQNKNTMRKVKKKDKKDRSSGLSIASYNLKKVFSNFKKNKEKQRNKKVKLKNLAESNQILKDRKELRLWEERLSKESYKLKNS